MHQLYFVAVPVIDAKDTIGETMNRATELLDENQFCSSDGGYFSSSKGDWYEVGGRWADFLVEKNQWAIDAKAEIDEYLNRPENLRKSKDKDGKETTEVYSIRGTSYGSDEEKEKQAELRERVELIWGKHRPIEYPKVPYDRWYKDGSVFGKPDNAIDDCAEIITQETIDYIKKMEEQYKQGAFGSDGLEVFVQDTDECVDEYKIIKWFEIMKPEDIIGKYWLVVIDYHS